MGVNAAMFFQGADDCDGAPVIDSVLSDRHTHDCAGPVGHHTTAALTTTGELGPNQLYEYENELDGGGFFFHSRTTAKTRSANTQCGGPIVGACREDWAWRCKVVKSTTPFDDCTGFTTSGVKIIEGDSCGGP